LATTAASTTPGTDTSPAASSAPVSTSTAAAGTGSPRRAAKLAANTTRIAFCTSIDISCAMPRVLGVPR
jgi:hypothetical protein